MWCCQFREPEIGIMDITDLARYSTQMIAGLALESAVESATRQLWIAACPDCALPGSEPPWTVFEARWLMERWIAAHEVDLGHLNAETWAGLSAV